MGFGGVGEGHVPHLVLSKTLVFISVRACVGVYVRAFVCIYVCVVTYKRMDCMLAFLSLMWVYVCMCFSILVHACVCSSAKIIGYFYLHMLVLI